MDFVNVEALEMQKSAFKKARNFKQKAPYYIPIIQWLPKYDTSWILADVLAGLAISAVIIPQGIG